MNASTTTATVEKLRDTVRQQDALSKGGFSTIESAARMALLCLESPDCSVEDVAAALRVIEEKAESTMPSINNLAGEVGCSYVCPRQTARGMARAAQDEQHQGA